ncbi:MAG: phosphoribosyltransferase [Thaumarchaeota archaeon]|nr:phosphoribosyltransferase [Nitrososphaerota archaeon]
MAKVYDYKNWSEIESAVTKLVQKLKDKKLQFKTISTISRGGLVPARLLADRLGIKQIIVDGESIPSDSLFVDDIYDSGETFRKIIQKVDEPDELVFATIYARKKKTYPKQLVYAEPTRDTEYIVYPWDRFEHGMPYEAH